jgi:DNA repair exonuclease SbcCD ATPase subunit
MAEELRAIVAAQDRLAEDLKRLYGEIELARAAVREAEKNCDALDERIHSGEASRSLVVRENGGAGRDEIAERNAKRRSTEEQLGVASAEVRSRMLAARVSDQSGYADDVRRQLADAERDGIPRTGRTPAEVQQLIKRLAAAREKKKDLESEQTNVKEERAFAEGTTRSLGGVLEKLLATEQEIARINEEIADLELNKRGASLAAGIFRTMANDSGAMLGQLAAEMQQTFEGLLAVPRTITVETFNSETISAVDAGGALRPVSHLSKGTRDTLTFAARLTLAMKADPAGEKRLLVLDEPFTSLDPERTSSALRLVRRLQDERGWQVVLFTKDPGLADGAMAELKDPVRHDL